MARQDEEFDPFTEPNLQKKIDKYFKPYNDAQLRTQYMHFEDEDPNSFLLGQIT